VPSTVHCLFSLSHCIALFRARSLFLSISLTPLKKQAPQKQAQQNNFLIVQFRLWE
jgi:hypothetical protein